MLFRLAPFCGFSKGKLRIYGWLLFSSPLHISCSCSLPRLCTSSFFATDSLGFVSLLTGISLHLHYPLLCFPLVILWFAAVRRDRGDYAVIHSLAIVVALIMGSRTAKMRTSLNRTLSASRHSLLLSLPAYTFFAPSHRMPRPRVSRSLRRHSRSLAFSLIRINEYLLEDRRSLNPYETNSKTCDLYRLQTK